MKRCLQLPIYDLQVHACPRGLVCNHDAGSRLLFSCACNTMSLMQSLSSSVMTSVEVWNFCCCRSIVVGIVERPWKRGYLDCHAKKQSCYAPRRILSAVNYVFALVVDTIPSIQFSLESPAACRRFSGSCCEDTMSTAWRSRLVEEWIGELGS